MWLCGVHYLCSIYHISYNLSEFIKLEFRVASSRLSLFIKFYSSSLFFWFSIFKYGTPISMNLSISQISTNLVTACWSNSVCQPAIFCWLGSWWKSEATLNSTLAHCHEIALLAAGCIIHDMLIVDVASRKEMYIYIYIYMFNFNSQSTTPQGESLKLVSCIILIYMDSIHLYCYYCISPFNK